MAARGALKATHSLAKCGRSTRSSANSARAGAVEKAGANKPKLLELQRQIAIGIWKLRQQAPTAANFVDDVEMLADSQAQAQSMLSEAAEQIRDPSHSLGGK